MANAIIIIRARVIPLAEVYLDRTFEIIGKGWLLNTRLTGLFRTLDIRVWRIYVLKTATECWPFILAKTIAWYGAESYLTIK